MVHAHAGCILEIAKQAGCFRAFLASIKIAGAAELFCGGEAFTLFAPTDRAFRRLPAKVLDGLLGDNDRLVGMLSYHMVPGVFPVGKVGRAVRVRTALGRTVTLRRVDAAVAVNGARITRSSPECRNGALHAINRVLLPGVEKERRGR